jgi:predicted sugar kinase
MAMDPSGITTHANRQFSPGEVVFSINLPLKVKMTYTDDDKNDVTTTHKRKALIKHSVLLIQDVLKFHGSFSIDIEGEEYPHCGFGSSGRLMAAIGSAVNEIFGSPINDHILLKYLAQNHGEDINGDEEHLMPVQCIGGSAASGLYDGSFLLISGKSVVIMNQPLSDELDFVIGYPKDYIFRDAQQLMTLEMENLYKFENIGIDNGNAIAYRILHEMIPAIIEKRYNVVGDIIEWYRFELGSVEACSFVYKGLEDIGKELLLLRRNGIADIISLSSVGPSFFALTKRKDECISAFMNAGLETIVCKPFNTRYTVTVRI